MSAYVLVSSVDSAARPCEAYPATTERPIPNIGSWADVNYVDSKGVRADSYGALDPGLLSPKASQI